MLIRKLRIGLNGWVLAATVLVAVIAIPAAFIVGGVFQPAGEVWQHLAATVLSRYLVNTAILILGTAALTILLGVSTAWTVTRYTFPGHRWFSWALILPLAIPTYIVAFSYAGLFGVTGTVHQVWQNITGKMAYGLDIMNLPGLIVILSLVLYPYVYIIARASFMMQSRSLLETSQILGRGPSQTFFTVALPLARPAIIGGVTLVIMEVINDYGAAKYFGVDTFTTGIFRAWFSMGDADAAIRLSGFLMLFALLLISMERIQRGRIRFASDARSQQRMPKVVLRGNRAWAAFGICLLPVLLGFVAPLLQLVYWLIGSGGQTLTLELLHLVRNSFFLSGLAALLAVLVAVVVVYAAQLQRSIFTRALSRLSVLGYSIPGAVIAVGVMIPFAWLDRTVDAFARTEFGISTGLLLSGTLIAVTYAYLVRFLALAMNSVESGFERVCGHLDEAARSLGHSPLRTLLKVDLRLVQGSLLGAAILVFVDVLKELPLTLILRPFNFDTLATRAFELASDERLAHSAGPALVIIATGILPIILINHWIGKESAGIKDPKPVQEVLPC